MNDSVELASLQAHHAGFGLVESRQALQAPAGCWKPEAGQALSLQARRAGRLRTAHGRLRVTFDHADQPGSARACDHFLSRGESLYLRPGEPLVMESFGTGRTSSAYFSREPARASLSAAGAPGVSRRVPVMGPTVTRAATVYATIFIALAPVVTRLNALLLQKL